ncbi:uncharacterized protein cp110 isoform X2 [Pseudorasbora parva]|uniref:uncharacterized protein cp110 isoform X2 n=1 Tax=Pseudorasbora parva TaxID=51549 RepID=UPI00351EF6F5
MESYEDFIQRVYNSHYTNDDDEDDDDSQTPSSVIVFRGSHVLPPVLNEQQRDEMRRLRETAVSLMKRSEEEYLISFTDARISDAERHAYTSDDIISSAPPTSSTRSANQLRASPEDESLGNSQITVLFEGVGCTSLPPVHHSHSQMMSSGYVTNDNTDLTCHSSWIGAGGATLPTTTGSDIISHAPVDGALLEEEEEEEEEEDDVVLPLKTVTELVNSASDPDEGPYRMSLQNLLKKSQEYRRRQRLARAIKLASDEHSLSDKENEELLPKNVYKTELRKAREKRKEKTDHLDNQSFHDTLPQASSTALPVSRSKRFTSIPTPKFCLSPVRSTKKSGGILSRKAASESEPGAKNTGLMSEKTEQITQLELNLSSLKALISDLESTLTLSHTHQTGSPMDNGTKHPSTLTHSDQTGSPTDNGAKHPYTFTLSHTHQTPIDNGTKHLSTVSYSHTHQTGSLTDNGTKHPSTFTHTHQTDNGTKHPSTLTHTHQTENGKKHPSTLTHSDQTGSPTDNGAKHPYTFTLSHTHQTPIDNGTKHLSTVSYSHTHQTGSLTDNGTKHPSTFTHTHQTENGKKHPSTLSHTHQTLTDNSTKHPSMLTLSHTHQTPTDNGTKHPSTLTLSHTHQTPTDNGTKHPSTLAFSKMLMENYCPESWKSVSPIQISEVRSADEAESSVIGSSYDVDAPSILWTQLTPETGGHEGVCRVKRRLLMNEGEAFTSGRETGKASPGTPPVLQEDHVTALMEEERRRQQELLQSLAVRYQFLRSVSFCPGSRLEDTSTSSVCTHTGLTDALLHTEQLPLLAALVRGFLTRRLLRTERVSRLIRTIKDTRMFLLSFQRQMSGGGGGRLDLMLQERVTLQLRAARLDLHQIFFSSSSSERMHMIHCDRELRRDRRLRPHENKAKGFLSAATRKALERKKLVMLQSTSADRKCSPSEEEKWKLVPKICRVSKRINAR